MKNTMKMSVRRVFSLVLALLMVVGIMPIFATPVDATIPSCSGLLMEKAFPDAAFRNYVWTEVLHNEGKAPDSYRLSFSDSFDVATKTDVDISGLGIESLEGIEYFCALIDLDCSDNKLTELDLRLNAFLKKLDASKNSIMNIDLSHNLILASADLSEQFMEVLLGVSIDLGKIVGRRDLYEIKVDGAAAANGAYNKSTGILTLKKVPVKNVSFTVPAGNKKFELEVTLVQKSIEGIAIKEVFPDAEFAKYIWSKILNISGNFNGEYKLDKKDTEKIATTERLAPAEEKITGIKSLDGIEFFSELKKLFVSNNKLEKADFTANTKLEELDISGNKLLEELVVKENKELKELNVSSTALKAVDVSANTKLTSLNCEGLGLTSLDVSKNTELQKLDCSSNALTSLYLTKNTKLTELDCSYNALTGLDLDKCTKLKNVKANGQEKTIDISNSSINLRNLAEGNSVVNVKINGKDAGDLYNKKTGMLSINSAVWNITYDTYVTSTATMSVKLNVKDKLSGKELGDLFPDNEFAKYVWTSVLGHTSASYDDDNELTVRETYTIAAVTTLDVSDEDIKSLSGISYFTALVTLDCSDNELTSLDLSGNKYLTKVDCSDNNIASLNVTKNYKLETLICDDNKLTSVDVTENEELKVLDVSYNALTSLDVTENDELNELDCSHNKITSLDLTKNDNLDELDCSYNALVYVDLSETSINGKSYVDANNQTVTVEMTDTADLEKITGVDEELITVVSVNGKKTDYEFENGVVYSDSWIKTVEYKVEISWGKSDSKSEDMSVKLTNVYDTEGFAVTYKPGEDGTGKVKTTYKLKGKTLVLEDALYTRDGYVQIGWATKDGGELVYELCDDYTSNKSITLYPVWGEDTYTVRFDANGGKTSPAVKTVSYGAKYGKLPTPVREGYEFAGWYTARTGGEKITAGTKVAIRKDHTLYARWEKATVVTKYTLVFDVNGGEPLSMQKFIKGTVVDLDECVTKREGYTFEGWYLDEALTEKVTKVTMVCDITVYAKWKAETPAVITGSMKNFKLDGVYGGYADVDESLWYGVDNQGVVRDVTLLGIMVGDGANFRPTAEITIAEIVKMAAVVHNTYYGGLYTFDQTEGTYWFDTYIEYAIGNGIIQAGEFADYTAKATRAEMAYIFANALPEKELASISSLRPSDVSLSDKYADEITALYEAGIITGTNANGDFVGDRTITRAEAAAIIVRMALAEKRIAK